MARSLPLGLAPEWDRDFTVGVGVSVLLHAVVAALVVFLATMAPAPLPPLQSYTVELTDPSALGGRLAFGPLDRPIGRPARVAPASGGAPEGPPRTGEPAAIVPPKATKTAEPVKIAEAPPPTSPPPTAPPVTVPPTVPPPTLPPSTLPPATVPPATAPPSTLPPATIPPSAAVPPKPAEPPSEPERPKPVETAKPPVETPVTKPPDAGVTLRAETKRPEPKPPPQEAQVTRPPPPKPEPEKAKTTPKPPPPPEPAKAEAKVVPTEPPKPEVKPGTIKPERSAHAPTALAMKSDDVKAPRTTPGAAPTPAPTAPATGNAGIGNGGSAKEKVDEKFAAAAERWRSRMGNAGGGLDGAEGQQGPIGEGADQAGGGGTVVGTEFLIYRQRVSSIIKENWVETDHRSGIMARVRFEISPDGEVSNIRLERSSGDKAYDLSVIRAVQRSSPLPPPPERHRDDFHEVEIDFHPEEGGRASQ
jgi:TonB family protein